MPLLKEKGGKDENNSPQNISPREEQNQDALTVQELRKQIKGLNDSKRIK